MQRIGQDSAAFKPSDEDEYVSDNVIDLQIVRWAKAFTSLSPQEQRALLFRGRIAGYPSALVAFKQPLRPRSAGSATPGEDDAAPYVEAAVERILDKLRHCPPKSQDTTMNTVAFELNRLIAGNWPGISEHDLKARFLQACGTLSDVKSPKGKWTPRHFEEKWQNAKRDASTQPKPWPPESYEPRKSTDELGLEMWREAEPLTGTLGERYFRDTRKVNPERAVQYLRFHRAAFGAGKGKTMAAAIAAFRTSPDPESGPVAVHVIYVGQNGSKPQLDVRKKTFGHYSGTGAALYLMPVGARTIVAEGIEKALRCSNVTGLPAIAAGSDSAMKSMVIAPGIEELIVCADRGLAGERAAKRLARRAHAAGVMVQICYPPVEGKDWDECTDDDVRDAIESAPLWEPDLDDEPEPEPKKEWRESEPIEAPLYPVPAFDAKALLPDGLRDFVTDEAYRMCAPVEYVAAASLSITSSLIGANCAIRPKRADNWLIVPNIWGALVGEPSQMKSPAMNAAARPLERVIAVAIVKHADAMTAAKGDKVVNEAREKVIKKKIEKTVKEEKLDALERLKEELKAQQTRSKEDEPVLRRFKTNDPTARRRI